MRWAERVATWKRWQSRGAARQGVYRWGWMGNAAVQKAVVRKVRLEERGKENAGLVLRRVTSVVVE
jgi:hypothetical protein